MFAIFQKVSEFRDVIQRYRKSGQTIGFVPTMGALHQGHLSLVDASIEECHTTVVSIFVNPTQFGPGEDLDQYPSTLKDDQEKLRERKVDLLFLPTAREMYPRGYDTYVVQEDLVKRLCGASRPSHFRGVLTVVLKLLNLVQPHKAYFGQKDFQQSVVIRRMVRDLHLPVKVRVLPIVREEDGLAMSSRNQYLSQEEREKAPLLYRGLNLARNLFSQGETSPELIKEDITQLVSSVEGAKLDYVEVVRRNNLQPAPTIKQGCVLALAVWFGKTRLIDNMIF